MGKAKSCHALRLVLGDQLTRDLASLADLDPAADVVLMLEVADETVYVPHHKQKIALVLSAMRHFAADLRAEGLRVDYVALDDPANTGSLTTELARAVARHQPASIVLTECGEWRVEQMMIVWQQQHAAPVEIRDDDRFFCSRRQFADWAAGRRTTRMEFFYRDMRRANGLLMEETKPVGGRWNFDAENRRSLPPRTRPPARRRFPPDATTQAVLELVGARFADHFGDLAPFGWAVTRADAIKALRHFIADCLPSFGDYQDAMKTNEPFLYHAVLSPYLNLGLLTAREVCAAAEAAWHEDAAPLNAVEGFIRQILGWREYVRGLYWRHMPGFAAGNALGASRRLPSFYWSGDTALNCIAQVVGDTRRHAYAHHIQRLMVTGNFALLSGVAPAEIEAWYLAVYADAYDWVELPNVHGMVMFADGGLLASKPYAASGAYIDRMSDYCRACAYDPKIKLGPGACPFNLLYWNFMMEHRDKLAGNPRMAIPYRTLDGMDHARRTAIADAARSFLRDLA